MLRIVLVFLHLPLIVSIFWHRREGFIREGGLTEWEVT